MGDVQETTVDVEGGKWDMSKRPPYIWREGNERLSKRHRRCGGREMGDVQEITLYVEGGKDEILVSPIFQNLFFFTKNETENHPLVKNSCKRLNPRVNNMSKYFLFHQK
ncbi:hypothetical protein AVEN_193535-1 [Araneus ventricosus]|uniref:Uncharacterized protein n=1 Tax=Araneus ventricosus TaxID=182803 RepID=A0A4Y2UJ95_ARAVE|nr:hypothetical protein AVEN_193535-1 [Araneus ventricosus]